MANVNIKFNNKEYLLSCDDGQEENLIELANHLNSKYTKLNQNLGNIGENKLLLITAIKMVDDYFDLLKKVKSTKNDFRELSKKFKELKSLAINYKNDKVIINKANLQNVYLDGKIDGSITFLPYFGFNLDLNLNSINFNRIYTFLINLDGEKRENLFLVNKKLNGKINLFIKEHNNYIDRLNTRGQGDDNVNKLEELSEPIQLRDGANGIQAYFGR